MKFVDEASIHITAGKGGNGSASFAGKNISSTVDLTVVMAAMAAVCIWKGIPV